eukprot:7752494-Pyramimonas_sp.AAC.1
MDLATHALLPIQKVDLVVSRGRLIQRCDDVEPSQILGVRLKVDRRAESLQAGLAHQDAGSARHHAHRERHL